MNKEEAAVMILWERWFEDSKGLDFETWMDVHGESEAQKIKHELIKEG